MDTTFITIHDLTPNATILYSSDSIVDILGYTPDEVVNRSTWEFFDQNDVPAAQKFHDRGVKLDKASVLTYCKIRNRQGEWVCCECCFSVVYDVMVCCISIYNRTPTSQKRAEEAPVVRRMFASSPNDPRYHMLSHLSSKFTLPPEQQTHEPRAALFLNRFTRTLTVMYATAGIEEIVGISSEEMKGRSFYYCIQENCLEDAVRCLETAKGNDSIAYMRFFFRDPRQDDPPAESTASESDRDEIMTDATGSEYESEAGTVEGRSASASSRTPFSASGDESGDSRRPSDAWPIGSPVSEARERPVELEAVISCTSDGLVVILRRARPLMPAPAPAAAPVPTHHGIFAAPWGRQPMFLPPQPPTPYPLGAQHPAMAQAVAAPFQNAFMSAIRDVAVFAWALTGINGCLAEFSRGTPRGDALPQDGFPVWAPDEGQASTAPSGYASGSGSGSGSSASASGGWTKDPFGDPGLAPR